MKIRYQVMHSTFQNLRLLLLNLLMRLGRFLYRVGRHESINDPKLNGEYSFIGKIIKTSRLLEGAVFFDIGGNFGEWTVNLQNQLKYFNSNQIVHVFEPSQEAFNFLQIKLNNTNARVYQVAVSSMEGERDLYVRESMSGLNSFELNNDAKIETVKVITLDDFCTRNNIDDIEYIKCDVEGYDLDVISGAKKLLSLDKIRAIQFEYTHRWISNNSSLKDLFNIIEKFNYVLCKLTQSRLIVFSAWHHELDKFFEGNYVLLRKGDPLLSESIIVTGFRDNNTPIYKINYV